MSPKSAVIGSSNKKSRAAGTKPVALILAGYNKVSRRKQEKELEELEEAYEGDIIYMGKNKFIYHIAGKPVIEYVLEAVYNARNTKGEKLYDKIYIYNDINTLNKSIDLKKYGNVYIKQMTKSVGGHFNDFCNNYITYGQRVDCFFGDTPRITSEDVEWIHGEYNSILGKEKDSKGNTINLLFGIAELTDMKDNWLKHRLKYIKVGRNKGKLKSFVGFENFQARVGNSCSFIMHDSIDDIIKHEAINFFYNLRKALTPKNVSRIFYYLWKTKHFNMIKQVRNKCINEQEIIDTSIDVISKLYKIDLSRIGVRFYHIKKNAARWENDIDGPRDLEAMEAKMKKKKRVRHD